MDRKGRSEWIERAKQRVLDNAEQTDEAVKEIMFLYDETAWQLETDINAMFQRYATDNKLTDAEASKLLSSSEYSRWRQSMDDYVKEAKGDSRTLLELNTLSAKSRISRKEEMLSGIYRAMITLSQDTETKLTDLLGDLYQVNYYRNCYDVQSVFQVGFNVAKIDTGTLMRILRHPWSGENYSETLWENTDKLAALAKREITLGFMAGSGIQKMAKEIDDVMQKGRYAAERVVRTESSYFSNQGRLDSYREMGLEEYTYLGGGCDICMALNGQSFKISEAEAGTNLPPMHPNCKCTTIPKTSIDLFKNRKGANPLKDNPKFEEWKKKYVKEKGLSAKVGGVDGVPEHEEKKLLGQVDYNNTRLVKSKIKNYTEQIAGDNKKENAVCITKNGDIYQCQGTAGAVYPDYDLKEELAEAFVTHNHPASETHFSFSDRDISMFMEYKLPELTGVDEKYIYRISRTDQTKYVDLETLVHSYKGDLYTEFMQAALDGEVDPDMDEYDFIVRRLAKEYGFEYERQER
ncbi:MAG: minor capsid protein [Ruminococcus sp.]|nr:minor capsid protein [Ruminococcus sp.]